jgi:hypothetical protein
MSDPPRLSDEIIGLKDAVLDYHPSIYDCPYDLGDILPCGDPNVVYILRKGRIAIERLIHPPSGDRYTIVEFIGQSSMPLPLYVSPSRHVDESFRYTVVSEKAVIMEIPREEFEMMLDCHANALNQLRELDTTLKNAQATLERRRERIEELEQFVIVYDDYIERLEAQVKNLNQLLADARHAVQEPEHQPFHELTNEETIEELTLDDEVRETDGDPFRISCPTPPGFEPERNTGMWMSNDIRHISKPPKKS